MPRSRAKWPSSGDWVTPRLNDLKYFEKPPLQYWLGAATFDAFGVNEWTARLPSGDRRIARGASPSASPPTRLAGPDAGAFAALVLARHACGTSGSPTCSRSTRVLSFWLTVALCAFLLAQRPALPQPRNATGCCSRIAAAARRDADQGPGRARHSRRRARALLARHARFRAVAAPARCCRASRSTSLLTAPWFVLVSHAESGVRALLLHPRTLRAVPHRRRTTGPASGSTSCRGSCSGIMPWLLVWAWTLRRSWRATPIAPRNGFSWERFCLVWAALRVRVLQRVRLEAAVVHPADVPGAGAGAGLRADAAVVARAGVDRTAARDRRAAAAARRVRWSYGPRQSQRWPRAETPASRSTARSRPWLCGRHGGLRRGRHRRVRAVSQRHAPRPRRWASPRCRCRR